jgi:hypothetical protein
VARSNIDGLASAGPTNVEIYRRPLAVSERDTLIVTLVFAEVVSQFATLEVVVAWGLMTGYDIARGSFVATRAPALPAFARSIRDAIMGLGLSRMTPKSCLGQRCSNWVRTLILTIARIIEQLWCIFSALDGRNSPLGSHIWSRRSSLALRWFRSSEKSLT